MARLRNSSRLVGLMCLVSSMAPGVTTAAVDMLPDTSGGCADPGTMLPVVSVGAIGDVPRGDTIQAGTMATQAGLALVEFDPPTDKWVDDPASGPALVTLINCLAGRSTANGGPGRLALAPFWTGAFVARFALSVL